MDGVPATSRKFVPVNGTSQQERATDEILNILSLRYSERIKTDSRKQWKEGAMKMFEALCGVQVIKQGCRVFITLLVSLATAHGQRYEITPLFGGMFGGTWNLEQQGVIRIVR